jgi:hypothetical protein
MVDIAGKFRVSYKVAGQAYRDTIRRANAIRPPLGARVRAVLDAVLVLTTSYSKLVDSTTTRQIAEIAYSRDEVDGRDRERVRALLNQLAALDLIQITPTGRGRSARVVVSVKSTTPPTERGVYGAAESQTPPAAGKNTPLEVQETPPLSAAHLEVPRSSSEERRLSSKAEKVVGRLVDHFGGRYEDECRQIIGAAATTWDIDYIDGKVGRALESGAQYPSYIARALHVDLARSAPSNGTRSSGGVCDGCLHDPEVEQVFTADRCPHHVRVRAS